MSEQSPYHSAPSTQPGGAGYVPGAPTAPPAARPNVPGRISLAIAVVSVVLGMVLTASGVGLAPTMDIMEYVRIAGALRMAMLVLDLVALTLGIVGLLRPGLPRGAAGAGTALAAAGVASMLPNLVIGALV